MAQEKVSYDELESLGRLNRITYKLTGILGLTTGIGIIAWGLWSLVATLATFVYEEEGLPVEEILINNGLNEGLLLAPIVVALGVIILELKKIQDLMLGGPHQDGKKDAE